MTQLRQAIEKYHELLTPALASESQQQLDEQQQRRGLLFGTRPLCTILRPRFLTTAQYQHLQRALRQIMPTFAKAEQAALHDPAVLQQFMLSDWEKELLPFEPGFVASPTARMDCFYITGDDDRNNASGALAMTEYNAETPAAVAYTEVLSEIFFSLPIMREFEKRYEVHSLPTMHHVLHALNTAYRQWGGTDRMRIGIVDWKEVPTYSEFLLCQQYFRAQGYECVIADPREMDYRNGKLYAGGDNPDFEISMIYKRVLLTELVTRSPEGLQHPIIRAVNERAVCMVNPYRCKILHQKASLAVLSDEQNAHLFTPDEQRLIQAHIPWTRRLSERYTQYEGTQIDLVPFLSHNKDNFVLKPNDEYGGKGIVLGWTVSEQEWDSKLDEYVQSNTIVQRRVAIPSEPYPSMVDGELQIFDRMLDTNPYLWDGQFASGCLTRLSTAALLNVTAGGGSTVPTFVVEER